MMSAQEICAIEEQARWDLLRAAKFREMNLEEVGAVTPAAIENTRRAAVDFQMAAVAVSMACKQGMERLPTCLTVLQGGST